MSVRNGVLIGVAGLWVASPALAEGDAYEAGGAVSTGSAPYKPPLYGYTESEPLTPKPGLQVGARIGFGFAAGSIYDGLPILDAANGAIPVTLDIGARVNRHVYVGAYGSAAYVLEKTNALSCPEGFDCSIRNYRFGVTAEYHFLPSRPTDPYVGVGVGYDIMHNSVTGTVNNPAVPVPIGVEAGVTDRGWEFANVDFGIDFRMNRHFALGPNLTATLSEYNVRTGSQKSTPPGTETSFPDVSHSLHAFFILALRGTYNL